MDINSEKLKALRDAKPWSQDELAIASGLSVRTIQRAEREGVASLQTLKAIAATFNVDASVLRPAAVSATPLLSNHPSSNPVEHKPATRNWRRYILLAAALVCIGIVAAVVATKKSWFDFRRVEDIPLAERLLGHWESSSTGRIITVNLDGKLMNPTGLQGNSNYSVLGDVISFPFGGQIVSMRVKFESPTEMTWTAVRTGAVSKWSRERIKVPSREALYASIKGQWRGTGEVRLLEIGEGKLRMQMANGQTFDTSFLLDTLQIILNRDGVMEPYAVSLDSLDQMTWTKVYSPDKVTFVRMKP